MLAVTTLSCSSSRSSSMGTVTVALVWWPGIVTEAGVAASSIAPVSLQDRSTVSGLDMTPPLRVTVSSSPARSVTRAELIAIVAVGLASSSGSAKIHGRACLMASRSSAVILNSISTA